MTARKSIVFATLASVCLPMSQAWSQGVTSPDADFRSVSPESVDPVSGYLALDIAEFTMGDDNDALPINLVRSYRSPTGGVSSNVDPFGDGWSHNYIIGAHHVAGPIGSNGHSMNAVIGKQDFQFNATLINNVWSYSTKKQDGATAVAERISGTTNVVLTTHDGYRYYFPMDSGHTVQNTNDDGFGSSSVLTAMISKVVAPNGETLKFFYSQTSDPSVSMSLRLDGLSHSRGYGIVFKYLAPGTTGGREPSRQTINQVVLADTMCPTFPYGCDETAFRKYNFDYSSYFFYRTRYRLTSARNAVNEQSRYEYDYDRYANQEHLSRIYTPADSITPSIVLTYGDSTWGLLHRVVRSMTIGGDKTEFTYPVATSTCPANPAETVRKDPLGGITKYRYFVWLEGEPDGLTWCAAAGGAVTEVVDPNNRVTKFGYGLNDIWWGYGGRNFRTKVTSPEGDYVKTTLDYRGNIISSRRVDKTQDPNLDIVVTSDFPTCTASNFRICNKPDYEVDARNARTDYSWSDAHGGVLSIKRPMDGAGNRPEVSYYYSPFTGLDGSTFYLLSSQVERIDASRSVSTNFEYDATKGFVLKGKVVTADGQSLRTCYGHDRYGNKISETKPRAGLSGCL